MGRSKRAKVVHLTKTKKKPKDNKTVWVEKVRGFVNKFDNIFVFSHENMTTVPFRAIQAEFADSKFCIGKNKIMKVALGRTEEDTFKPLTFKLSEQIGGECGIFFTNRKEEEVLQFFEEFKIDEFAKAGYISPQTIILNKGVEALKQFSHSMEPYLRKLGLKTSLINTEIHLLDDVLVAQEGEPLNPEQAKILHLLGVKLAEFKLVPKVLWNKNQGIKTY